MSLRGQDAPQVAYLDEPLPFARDQEGLQATVQKSEESLVPDIAPDVVEENHHADAVQPRCLKTRPLWILMIVAGCIISIGVGLGAGFAIGRSDRSSSSDISTTPTSFASESSLSPTATSALVTPSTGVASFSCNNREKYTTSGSTFVEECNVDYPTNYAAWNATTDMPSTTRNLTNIHAYTLYSFKDCMDTCVQWNLGTDSTQTMCMAVTYNANLTEALSGPGITGTCWLKDARGTSFAGDDTIDYSYVASAYILQA